MQQMKNAFESKNLLKEEGSVEENPELKSSESGFSPSLLAIFSLFTLVAFALYLPAAKAGFVADFTDWLKAVRNDSFLDYINRKGFYVKSLYQVTQTHTWLWYQLLGTSKWGWHLLFVIWHAFNATLLFSFLKLLFKDSKIGKSALLAAASALLLLTSPYVSEVVVWEPSFHYLQAGTLVLGIMILIVRYLHKPRTKNAILISILYAVGTFTHEIFYLILPFIAALLLYYRLCLQWSPSTLRTALYQIVLPVLALFLFHLLLYQLVYGSGISHVGSGIAEHPWPYYAVKPPYYFFHLSAWGRFWPENLKGDSYAFFRKPIVTVLFYSLLLLSVLLPLWRLKRLSVVGKASFFLYGLFLLSLGLFVPLYFPDLLLVVCDRYTYPMLWFWCPLLVLLLSIIRFKSLRYALFLGILLANLFLTLYTNFLWKQSAERIDTIQYQLPNLTGKIGLYLNSPACLNGVPMIGAVRSGEVRLMHNLLYPKAIMDTLLDVAAYNLTSIEDGANVKVINDSVAVVALNQWGSWWWYGAFGLSDYETEYFSVKMLKDLPAYELTLKMPSDSFVLIFQNGDRLRQVDWNLRNRVQL